MMSFIVFTLPRSRSAWLSHLLSCGHDTALDSKSVADFLDRVDSRGGTVETGAIVGAHVIRELRPDINVAVIKRPVSEVMASLASIGIIPARGEIEHRAKLLDELARQVDVLALDWTALDDFEACDLLMQFCLGAPCPRGRFEHYSQFNIQLNIPRRIEKLFETAETMTRIKAELAEHATRH